MSASDIAVQEVDGRRMHLVFDGLAEGVAAVGAELEELGRVAIPSLLAPPSSRAFQRAEALLGFYLSRVDYLRHRETDRCNAGIIAYSRSGGC